MRRPLLSVGAAALSASAPLWVAAGAAPSAVPAVALSAVYADGYLPGDADEAIQIRNLGPTDVDVGGWRVVDGTASAGFPAGTVLPGGAAWWVTRDAGAFALAFGHPPAGSWGDDRCAVRMVASGGGPRLANVGDRLVLEDGRGSPVDAVAYGDAPEAPPLWHGPAVQPYRTTVIAGTHQVLYRKIDPATGALLPDTDSWSDWSSDPDDVRLGRRARYPGWDLESRLAPEAAVAEGHFELAVAPDGLYPFLARHLRGAERSIDLMAYTLEHAALADVLAERARAGVRVRILVDGSPAGGISHDQRWCMARVAEAGGDVYWLADGGDVRARYRSAHAKVALVDGRRALLGSENPGLGSAPHDSREDGTAGRRGVWLATDASAVVAWLASVVAVDLDPESHPDVRPFQPRDPGRGAPAQDYVPAREGGGTGYEAPFSETVALDGAVPAELVSAPENALHPTAGLLGLLSEVGEGDELLVEQMRDPVWWGGGPAEGPPAQNPRVQAYVEAARRGARVRVLLDGYFDDPAHWNGNHETVRALRAVAAREGLALSARLGNPTGKGIHNKMILVTFAGPGRRIGDRACGQWLHVGSLNGSEAAHKVNRELALQLCSPELHAHLRRVFEWDWAHSPGIRLWLPAAHAGMSHLAPVVR